MSIEGDEKVAPSFKKPMDYINSIEDEDHRRYTKDMKKLFENVIKTTSGIKRLTKPYKATMWGKNIVGFGVYHYKYNSGREGEHFRCGFSARKTAMTFYFGAGFDDEVIKGWLEHLGKHKLGKACLYISFAKFRQLNRHALKQIVQRNWEVMEAKYPIPIVDEEAKPEGGKRKRKQQNPSDSPKRKKMIEPPALP